MSSSLFVLAFFSTFSLSEFRDRRDGGTHTYTSTEAEGRNTETEQGRDGSERRRATQKEKQMGKGTNDLNHGTAGRGVDALRTDVGYR